MTALVSAILDIDAEQAAGAAAPSTRHARRRRQLQRIRAATRRVMIDLSVPHAEAAHGFLPRAAALSALPRPAIIVQPPRPIELHPTPRWKRCMDILGAAMLLIALAPLMAAVALCIKLTSRGPVLFTQWRAGFGNVPFRIYKFRTMVQDADARKRELLDDNEQDGPVFKMANDPRLTRLGRFLRRSSIDELPQLWNVLKGDMSLVGPRPLACEESDRCLPWQRQRLGVAPGITCIWQVSGRSLIGFDQWVKMDLDYIARRGFLTDLCILLRTIPAVLTRRGAK